jgi:hypothetical protein
VPANGPLQNDQDFFIKIKGGISMLWTIFIILLVLWALGFGFAGQSLGMLVHVLLVVALVVLVMQLITGRRPTI